MGKEQTSFNSGKCGTEGRPNGNCPNRKPENYMPKFCEICISDSNIWNLKPGIRPVMYTLLKLGMSDEQANLAELMIQKIVSQREKEANEERERRLKTQ